MPSTRQRAFKLRSGNAPMIGRAGRIDPLTQADRARASINNLTQYLPPNSYILVPRTWKEAHNRPDSLCAILGIPFTELGPLLFKAGILVKNNLHEGLSFSLNGFQRLIDLYNRKESLEIGVEKIRPSLNAWKADPLVNTNNPPNFFCIFRGSKNPSSYKYIPLCPADVVVDSGTLHVRARVIGREISQSFDPETAALFAESRQPVTQSFTSMQVAIAVDTSKNSDAPNLITPDNETERCCAEFSPLENKYPSSWLSMQSISESIYAGFDQACGTSFFASLELSEASETETQCLAPSYPATIAEEMELSRQLDFDVRINNQRPPRHPDVGTPIDVTDRKLATEAMRAKIVWLAEQWGYRQFQTRNEKLVIAEMASRVVFYDMGCPKPPKGSMVANWISELDNARINNSTNFAQVLTTEQLGPRKGTYPDQIEAANPGYLHDLFRLIANQKSPIEGLGGKLPLR